MNAIMTAAEVAEYFRHPEPHSRAGAEFVRRLVAQGLPTMANMRPMRFVRAQVEAFAAELATRSTPATTPPQKRRPGKSTRARPTDAQSSIAARLDRMRRGAS